MLRVMVAIICLVTASSCSAPDAGPPVGAAVQPVTQPRPPEPTRLTINSPIDSTPEPLRGDLLKEAVVKVATEYHADWMLQPNEGSEHLLGQLELIYAQGRPNLTFYDLVKQGFQNTREDFLNRAEVARTSAEILYRAQVQADRQREIDRLLREQERLAERLVATEQATFRAQAEARARTEAAYASAAADRQYAQQYPEPVERGTPVNPSRFDPENVGFDSRRGYTAPRYASRDRSESATQVQTAPRRFQDQFGNWYEQPPGSGFARNERTGQQCIVNGATVQCN